MDFQNMTITRRQLVTLFVTNIILWTVNQALGAMLPVYALRLGAEPAAIGNFLGFAILTMPVGGVLAGWLADKLQRRKILLAAAAMLNIPAIWLMSQVTDLGQLTILTGLFYFFLSIGFAMILNLAGLSAGEAERGKVFGVLGVTGSIGGVIAGSASGVIANRWGFPALFVTAALVWALALLVALLVEEKAVTPTETRADAGSPAPLALGWSFYVMLGANLIAFGCSFVAILGRPLQMDGLGFDPATISSIIAISSAVSIPLPFLLGWVSDRMNRYSVVAFCFLIGALGLFALIGASQVWHFAVANALLGVVGASMGISQALVTDLVPPKSLGMALSLYNAALQIGIVTGLISTGNAIQIFGLTATYIAGAVFTLVSIGMLFAVQVQKNRQLAQAKFAVA
jgi:NNP family nitrate/nitrite transporter-like MFS transporter